MSEANIEIRVVTRTKQVFTTWVSKDDLLPALKSGEFDFAKPFVMGSNDLSKNPQFIINSNHIESITLKQTPPSEGSERGD